MNKENQFYCNSQSEYSRLKTRVVNIGHLPLGGNNPIRIQSMTTTNTMDTIATVEQTIRMVESGCEYVRITAPSIREAENLGNIKAELLNRGYSVPLIADIHFTPNAAEAAAELIEKVRVNPGNYVDKKKFQQIEYSDAEYDEEIERIRERFTPLVKICKEYGTAMRIGTNHGSLSDRIMSRYGDTPLGMVESALEFVRICEAVNYHDIVLSMKASNTRVMVQAYRLLINKMFQEGMNYPLHLGVTEAGDGEDGRIKSAVGIGALLEDGIGDTIRVSLTEEPENEAPVAIALANRYKSIQTKITVPEITELPYNPFEYSKRLTLPVENIGGGNLPIVVADFGNVGSVSISDLSSIGYTYNADDDKWNYDDMAADYIFLGDKKAEFELPQSLIAIQNFSSWQNNSDKDKTAPLLQFRQLKETQFKNKQLVFVEASIDNFEDLSLELFADKNIVLVLTSTYSSGVLENRRLIIELMNKGIKIPVILKGSYKELSEEDLQLDSAVDFGSLLIDGFGDGVWAESDSDIESVKIMNRTLFGILQAARVRISKTEYIACPSCGRTLFDLVKVTNKIRNKTGHLKGLKIGIMGCIVNGPGEMADADYGYVGSGPGKISLYKQKEVVRRNLNSEEAVEELISLIKEHGDWVEPV